MSSPWTDDDARKLVALKKDIRFTEKLTVLAAQMSIASDEEWITALHQLIDENPLDTPEPIG